MTEEESYRKIQAKTRHQNMGLIICQNSETGQKWKVEFQQSLPASKVLDYINNEVKSLLNIKEDKNLQYMIYKEKSCFFYLDDNFKNQDQIQDQSWRNYKEYYQCKGLYGTDLRYQKIKDYKKDGVSFILKNYFITSEPTIKVKENLFFYNGKASNCVFKIDKITKKEDLLIYLLDDNQATVRYASIRLGELENESNR